MIQSEHIQLRRQVLVVEDQELNRDILGMILENDYDVLYAENGAGNADEIETLYALL